MIKNDDQLAQARDAVASLERSLSVLQKDKPTLRPDRYALMADPIVDDLNKLRQSIDEYIWRQDHQETHDQASVPPAETLQ